MSRTSLKNARYSILGYIETRADGAQVSMDAYCRIVGDYRHSSNLTVQGRVKYFLGIASSQDSEIVTQQ